MRLLLALALAAMATVQTSGQDTEVRSSIQEVKAKHQDELLAEPGVVSVGIAKDGEETSIIVVGMDRERPDVRRRIPEVLEGYAVRIEILGTIGAR